MKCPKCQSGSVWPIDATGTYTADTYTCTECMYTWKDATPSEPVAESIKGQLLVTNPTFVTVNIATNRRGLGLIIEALVCYADWLGAMQRIAPIERSYRQNLHLVEPPTDLVRDIEAILEGLT